MRLLAGIICLFRYLPCRGSRCADRGTNHREQVPDPANAVVPESRADYGPQYFETGIRL